MKKTLSTRAIVYGVLALVALFVIFFIGKEYNSETKTTSVIVSAHAVQDFRLGLDIAGGVRLNYKLDLSKYKENFPDPVQYATEKNFVIQRMLQQIGGRISSLGVSDYSAYPQNLDGDDYIVVEIGGITDLNQAKAIIGKTVELEFKLRNQDANTASGLAARKALAQDLFAQAQKITGTGGLDGIAGSRESDDIYVNTFTKQTLDKLPNVYQDNVNMLVTAKTGAVLPQLFNGVYANVAGATADDGSATTTQLSGYTIAKLVDRQTQKRTTVTADDVVMAAKQLGLASHVEVTTTDGGLGLNNFSFQSAQSRVVYNGGPVFADTKAYKVKAYALGKTSLVGKSTSDIAGIESGEAADLAALVATVKAGKTPDAKVVADSWMTEDDLKKNIDTFTGVDAAGIYTYNQTDASYVLQITQVKQKNDTLYTETVVDGVSPAVYENFAKSLETETLYTIQDIFVEYTNTWVTAKDKKTNSVLNGGYFDKAVVDHSQTGEPVVRIDFDKEGGRIFCNITTENKGKQMAIFVGGKLATAPTIDDAICGGSAIINGNFTVATAQDTTNNINAGALPAPMILAFEEVLSPTLGQDALFGAMWAALVGIVLVFIFMTSIYGIKRGLISFTVLVTYMLILMAFVKSVDYALSLSGIAAVILSIGMGVDATVLIFERVREELKAGRNMYTAIEVAYERSWLPIRDGQLSTGLIALVLFMVGTSVLRGFGLMMIVTILLLLTVATPLTRELLHLAFRTKDEYKKDNNTK